MKRYLILSILLIIAVGIVGCKPKLVTEQTSKNYNYQIFNADNNYEMTMSELYNELYSSKLLRNGGVLDTSLIRNFLDSLIVDSLTSFEADEVKLEDHYNDYRIYKLQYYDVLIRAYLDKFVYNKVQPDSLDVIEFFKSRKDLFYLAEQVKLYHILLTDASLIYGPDSLKYKNMSRDSLLEAVDRLVTNVYKEITTPSSFLEAAKKYSEDIITGRNGGLIGWVKRGVYQHPFDSIAFSMHDGGISEPYLDSSGWHILYIEKYHPGGLPELTEDVYKGAYDAYKTTETNKIGRELFDSLANSFELTYNDTILDKDVFKTDGQEWVAIVNGIDSIDVNELKAFELSYREQYQVPNSTPDMKKDMIFKISRKYVLKEEAINTGIADLPEIKEQERIIRQKNSRVVISKRIYDPDWKPTDEEIEAYYYSHEDEFQAEKPLVVQHIIVQDSVFGEYLREQGMSGYDFLELAKEYYPGEEAVRLELADLGAISSEDVPPEFYHAAMQVPVGEISHPVKTEFGYHIIKILEKKKSYTVEESKHKIVPILKAEHQREHFKNYRDELYRKYHVNFVGNIYPVHLKPSHLRTGL